MKINFEDMMHRVNCLASDLDSLYHQATLKLGLSDSVLFVLYLVYENDGRCPLNDIRKATNISKQTLNSAVVAGSLCPVPHGDKGMPII